MGLVGFPENIKVVLGDDWSPGQNSLDPTDVLLLTKAGEFDGWSEDGSLDADLSTNRLLWTPSSFASSQSALLSGARDQGTVISWNTVGFALLIDTGDYSFLSIWNGTPDYNFWSGGVAKGWLADPGGPYNPDIFSTLQAAAAGDLNVLEGETAIPDGTTTPRDFGSVVVGADKPQKTWTVENLGDLDVNGTGVNVPEGYEIDASSEIQDEAFVIAGGTSKDLVCNLLTDTPGTFTGDVEILSDDEDEGTYNFAVTGTVLAADIGNVRSPYRKRGRRHSPRTPR